jgi:hypothetical protein
LGAMSTARSCFAYALACALFVSGCNGSPTSASSTTTTTISSTTAAAPATTEQFTGVLPVNGAKFYSFTVSQFGTVNITLTNVSGQFVPATVTLGLGLGHPDGEDCAMSTSLTAKSAATAQITGSYDAGVYCARVYDVGNLFGPANFNVQIDYP